jgi:RHS repeat-associated protein
VYGSQGHSPDYLERGGVRHAYVKNHLGSVRLVVKASTAEVAQRLDYDAWGNVTLDTNPGFQPFGFAGGVYDGDTKLTHFGYRDYDAESGTWTAKDPIRLRGGFGVYVYAGGNPVRVTDRSGLVAGVDDAIGLALSLAIGEALVYTGVIAAGVWCIGTHCLGSLDDLLGTKVPNEWKSSVSNPYNGAPNSCSTNPGSEQIRGYGADGKPSFDIDYDHDHGQGVPHIHDWSDGKRGPGMSPTTDPWGEPEAFGD